LTGEGGGELDPDAGPVDINIFWMSGLLNELVGII
jgi:hypothetical protein